ncbi:trypsin-like peptidase domain-containing protein [Streptomyces sp. DH24]|uniref:VMAP-C domain-containing protein n=1 Tax=Streptomyces sp. DH24 TaxID=3040123 RepID=UPI002441E016|nr:trypsin-like peptidase domain-containing protein [Streptomyces sp. DH24]MDG9717091.1 trypsin-like peptidase domain-containing protein [Streptomyces sp. DH24]
MSSAAWHARIECGGRVAGAGFLVTPTKVLTCAHVVQDGERAPLTVTFTERPGLPPVAARVAVHGGWSGGTTDLGDLAVLELEREVAITPAALAPARAAHGEPPRKLVVYGFPSGFDEGTLAEYRTTGPQLIKGEWIQLEAWRAEGQPLARGFSGAAVTLTDTGEVVGMVTAAAGAKGVRNGRMMPTEIMARYWPGLESLVPATAPRRPGPESLAPGTGLAPGPGPADRARLRDLVEKAVRAGLDCEPEALYTAAADPFDPPAPEDGFDSLRSAALFVLSELDGPRGAATVARFADRLEALLCAPAPSAAPDWSPILVELGPSGAGQDLVRVEVSAYSGGRRYPVGADTVPQARLRAHVQDRIDAAARYLTPGTDELVTFALPRDWLDWPVDRWESAPDDPTPLGCAYPVVVTDHARRKGGARHVLTRAWQRLDARTGARVHRVECGCPEDPKKLRLMLRRSDGLAGFAAAPHTARARPHFDALVTAPAPVILWSRAGCGAGDGPQGGDHDCTGTAFLDALDAHVGAVPPAELPRAVLALREEADAEDGHWARDIQLLWDDPRCFTDRHERAVHAQSPVA